MLKDLSRILQLLKKNFQGVKVVDVMELICGKGLNLEKAETAAKSALAINTVHPTGHGFAKMSLSPPTTAALPAAPAPDNVTATTRRQSQTANKSYVGDSRNRKQELCRRQPRRKQELCRREPQLQTRVTSATAATANKSYVGDSRNRKQELCRRRRIRAQTPFQ